MSGRISPTSREYALCRATVFLPRHGCTVIPPSLSPPVTPIWCFEIIRVDPPCAIASPIQRRGARRNERLLHFALSSASYMPSWRPSAAAHPSCPFLGAAMLCASHQSQPAVQLPFGRLHSNLALVSFIPEVGSPIQRSAWWLRRMRLRRRPHCCLQAGLPWDASQPLWPPPVEVGGQSRGACGPLVVF